LCQEVKTWTKAGTDKQQEHFRQLSHNTFIARLR